MVAAQLGQMRAESVSFRMTHPIKMAAHLVTNATTQLRPAFDRRRTVWIGFRGAACASTSSARRRGSGLHQPSPVATSKMDFTSATTFAGKRPPSACARTMSALAAW
jgi:FAD/FMN-containing dehydrogenase